MAQYTDTDGQSNVGRAFVVSAPEIRCITPEGEKRVLLTGEGGGGDVINIEETSSEEAEVIVSPAISKISSVNSGDSKAYFFGGLFDAGHEGPGDIIPGGHIVGALGRSVNNSDSDVYMAIGLEGRVDHNPGPIGETRLAKGVLGLISNKGAPMPEVSCVSSEIYNLGVMGDVAGFRASVTVNAGSMEKYSGYIFENLQFLPNVVQKRAFDNRDPSAPIVSVAPIVEETWLHQDLPSGSSFTYKTGVNDFFLVNRSNIASFTITLPTIDEAVNGQMLYFSTHGGITNLTVNAPGATVLGAPTTLGPNGVIRLKFLGAGTNYWVLR